MTPPEVEGNRKTIILYPVESWAVREATCWMMRIKCNTEE